MIPVTKTFLPSQEEYQSILSKAWEKGWLTNRGSLVCELEDKLTKRFDVNNVIATTNGTLPLQLAIKALGLKGEIITTPFSYIATASSIAWEGCQPVFVDIDPVYLTIDEQQIEAKITERTSAILATHVYGNACNIEAIEQLAKKHHLKVIYDAAHCFGVNYKGKSIFSYGDVSTCSFHATKIFHSGEGGALFTNNDELAKKLFYHHNFGHNGPEAFHGVGINAKMSELQAAMGLAVYNHLDEIFVARAKIVGLYNDLLNGKNIQTIQLREGVEWNCHYYPIILASEKVLLETTKRLAEENIFPRRYFYPSLNTLSFFNGQSCPVSEDIAQRILCLPLYVGLKKNEIEMIVNQL